MSNGLKFDAQDRLIAAEGADYGGRRVTRTDMKTGKSYIIAGQYEGQPFNSPRTVGTPVTRGPPHRPGRAVFPHPVPRSHSLSRGSSQLPVTRPSSYCPQ